MTTRSARHEPASDTETNVRAPLLSVIIISYNTREMTLECLRTLYSDLGALGAEVWVVDNASTDGSPAAIRAAFPDIRLIENDQNRGFGAANNQAMRLAHGEYFLLLNSDAFLRPGAVTALMHFLEQSPGVAVAGPRLLHRDLSLQRSCYRFPTPLRAWLENLWISEALSFLPAVVNYRRWPHDRVRTVDYVIGACMLVRRSAYQQVGSFDERFFMYAEEADWQKRMRDHGWKVAFTPSATVIHWGGASGAVDEPKINRHFFDSLDHYERKHHGATGLLSLRLAMIVGCLLRLLAWAGVFVALPGRRAMAAAKIRLHSWLCLRQAFCWRELGSHAGDGK